MASALPFTESSCASMVCPSSSNQGKDVDATDCTSMTLGNLTSTAPPNQASVYGNLLDLPTSLRILRPVFQNITDFGYEFDSKGILRNVQTGETLSMKVAFTGASLKRQEMIRAICTRQVRQRLFEMNMESSQIPVPGHPTLCMRVLHSSNLFTHTGPLLIILQAGGVAQAGVWATRLLMHPQHGLRSGSQIELIRKAHERGYAVAIINGNEHVPSEAEMDAMELVSALSSPKIDSSKFKLSEPAATSSGSSGTPVQSTSMTQVPRKITLGIPVSLGATTTLDGSQTIESSSITSTGVSSASSSASALYSLLLSGSTSRNDCPTTVGDKDGQDPSWVPQQNSTSCAPPLFTTGHHFLSSPLMSTAPLHMQASSSNSVATTDVTRRPSTFVKPAPPKVSSSNFLQAAGEVGDCNVSTTSGTATNVSGTTPPKPSEMKSATPCMSNVTWFAELSKSTGQRCAVNRSGKLQTVSSSLRNLEEQNLEVSLEDRLYGIWRQIIPHCASKKIVIWAHQQGGTALIHPLRPMPGAFPGFTPAQFNTTPSASLEESVSVLTGGNQRKYVGVSGASLRHDVRNSSDARGNSAEIAPSSFRPKSDQTISPFLRSRALQCHITAPNVRIGGVSINPPRTRYYSTRRRHVSANAVLTSSSTHSESLDNTYSSAVPMHAYVKQQEIVHFDSDLLQRAVSARIQLADIEEMRSKASAGRLWLDRRVYGPWRHHVSPAAARRAFQMPTDSNPTPPIGTTPSSSNTQETASSEPREHSLPSLSGSDVDTELFAQRGGVVPRGVGNWGPNPHVEDEDLLKIRLARAWQRKAQRLQTELISRVHAVVFTDCPSILNLALEGIGWGLHMLNESKTASGGCDVPTLFKVSALQSALPEKVASARQWFSQHAIHFVTSDTPIGTRLDDKTKRPVEVPVISSGTTEHDLIPATVLEAVFDFFESKLNPTTAGDDLKGQTIEKTPIINQTSSPAPPSNPIPSASDTTPTTNGI